MGGLETGSGVISTRFQLFSDKLEGSKQDSVIKSISAVFTDKLWEVMSTYITSEGIIARRYRYHVACAEWVTLFRGHRGSDRTENSRQYFHKICGFWQWWLLNCFSRPSLATAQTKCRTLTSNIQLGIAKLTNKDWARRDVTAMRMQTTIPTARVWSKYLSMDRSV
jgi:hypothetical protein